MTKAISSALVIGFSVDFAIMRVRQSGAYQDSTYDHQDR